MSVAVLHGNYFTRGGGERVADRIAKTFDAPLYYGFGSEDAIPDDGVERHKLFDPNPLSKKLAHSIHQYRDLQFMWQGLHLPELFEYDTIIHSGNEFGWYVPKQLNQTVVKYVHSPPRGPYDMHYKHGESRLHRAYGLAAKTLYGHTTSYVDLYVANSEVVAKRCRKAWDVEPEIIYPPVDVEQYGQEKAEQEREDTYLTFSRLYRHKRTREIVEAFDGLDAKLIVGGDGPQREHLEEIATDNVEVRGYLGESEKQRLLAEVDAFIFNAENEDFGIVPVEAFASGTPVIGVDDGFTRYQIQDGKNGITYPRGDQPGVIRGSIEAFQRTRVEWSPDAIEQFAEQFSLERFERELREAVETAEERTQIDSQLSEPAEVPHIQ